MAGYLDGQSRHGTRWQLDKIKSTVIVFLFWVTIYYLWEPYQRGYLINTVRVRVYRDLHVSPGGGAAQPATNALCGVIAALLLFSYGYDLLSALYPDAHVLSLSPQYRLWTWLLFYLTGQLFCDPQIAAWIGRKTWSGPR